MRSVEWWRPDHFRFRTLPTRGRCGLTVTSGGSLDGFWEQFCFTAAHFRSARLHFRFLRDPFRLVREFSVPFDQIDEDLVLDEGEHAVDSLRRRLRLRPSQPVLPDEVGEQNRRLGVREPVAGTNSKFGLARVVSILKHSCECPFLRVLLTTF